MKAPIIISVIFHSSILVFAALDIPFFDNDDDRPMEIIPVEIVDIAQLTKLREIVKLPEPQKDKPKPPKLPERVVEMPPTPPKLASTMPLEHEKTTAKPKPKPPVKRVQAPRISPRNRPRPPSRFSSDRIAALLNKVEDKRTATEKLAEKYAPKEQQMTSLDIRRQTMSISAAIQKKIEDQCWNPPSGALDAGSLKVKIHMFLTLDGNLARPPEVEGRNRMNSPGQEALRTAADSALRAVRMCAPYDDLNLPKDMYDQWREVIMNFDPSGMMS